MRNKYMKHNFDSLIRIFRQMNYVVGNRHKKAGVVVFVCMIVSSGMELLGVSVIFPFLQMMLTPDKVKEKWYISWLYHIFPSMSDRFGLIVIGVILIVIYLFKNAFMIYSAYLQTSFAARFQREMSIKMLSAYMRHPYQFFLNTNSGEIIRGINADVNGVYQIILNAFTLVAESMTIAVLGLFLFMSDIWMSVSAMTLAFLCLAAIILGLKGRMKEAGKRYREASGLKAKYGYQTVTGIKEIMVLDRKENFVEQYEEAALLEQRATIVNGVITACPDRILEGVCIGGIIGIVCIRITLGVELGTFIPVLGMFAMAAFKILPSISKISTRINTIIYYQMSLQEAYTNLQEARAYEQELEGYETAHRQNDASKTANDDSAQVEKLRFKDELKIDGIDWKYQNAKGNVLENASLTIRKGESVAFIGSSGAGKTTLADIIMGLLKPQKGAVEMDGIDIYSIPHQWCRIIGYVPQAVFLIDDTVRANVAFGLKENEIEEDKVWEALRQAQLKEFVEGLPYGLDTIVGERGVKFSGGQRQRIAIARALYEDPDILVLDEATSALDNETETAVMESIDALQGSKTLIIVAHRLTTIRNCDRIYEIADGVAVERKKEEVLS